MTLEQVLTVVRAGETAEIDRLAQAGALDFLTEEDKNTLTRAAARAGQAETDGQTERGETTDNATAEAAATVSENNDIEDNL